MLREQMSKRGHNHGHADRHRQNNAEIDPDLSIDELRQCLQEAHKTLARSEAAAATRESTQQALMQQMQTQIRQLSGDLSRLKQQHREEVSRLQRERSNAIFVAEGLLKNHTATCDKCGAKIASLLDIAEGKDMDSATPSDALIRARQHEDSERARRREKELGGEATRRKLAAAADANGAAGGADADAALGSLDDLKAALSVYDHPELVTGLGDVSERAEAILKDTLGQTAAELAEQNGPMHGVILALESIQRRMRSPAVAAVINASEAERLAREAAAQKQAEEDKEKERLRKQWEYEHRFGAVAARSRSGSVSGSSSAAPADPPPPAAAAAAAPAIAPVPASLATASAAGSAAPSLSPLMSPLRVGAGHHPGQAGGTGGVLSAYPSFVLSSHSEYPQGGSDAVAVPHIHRMQQQEQLRGRTREAGAASPSLRDSKRSGLLPGGSSLGSGGSGQVHPGGRSLSRSPSPNARSDSRSHRASMSPMRSLSLLGKYSSRVDRDAEQSAADPLAGRSDMVRSLILSSASATQLHRSSAVAVPRLIIPLKDSLQRAASAVTGSQSIVLRESSMVAAAKDYEDGIRRFAYGNAGSSNMLTSSDDRRGQSPVRGGRPSIPPSALAELGLNKGLITVPSASQSMTARRMRIEADAQKATHDGSNTFDNGSGVQSPPESSRAGRTGRLITGRKSIFSAGS
jgi:hypothetical protein